MTGADADILATAARVLRTEGAAVLAMADDLPDGFAAAVRLVLATAGRVVVSGMGKSGHVARKIAATLASTGTPALFVHPAEASHGDLGMVTPGDCCILLSNSGETAELRDLIAHCARFAIPLVALSRVAGSTLMRAAQVPLLLPDAPEACGFGMAPTTSTTLQLALGDALALAVMEARRFRPDQFRSYHPGGKLGAQLSEVHQIMHRGDLVPLVPRGQAMAEVILTMTAKGFGIAGLVDEAGLLVGVISDGDLRRNMEGLMGRTAAQVANRAPVTVAPEMLAAEALRVMNQRKIGALFVVEQGRPVGVLHVHDLLRAGVA
jgi:arabinose-5-phosphate isomerase